MQSEYHDFDFDSIKFMTEHLAHNRARWQIAFAKIIARANEMHGVSEHNAQDFVELGTTAPHRLFSGKHLFGYTDSEQISNVAMISELVDISQLMMKKGVDVAWEYLTSVVIPKMNEQFESQSVVTPFSTLIFESPLLEKHREVERAAMALNDDKGPLTDVTSCKKCGALKVHRIVKQTRSADEGATSIFDCPNCKFTWTEN